MALRPKLAPLLAPILQDGKPATAFIQTIGGQFEIVITGPSAQHGMPDAAVREAMTTLADELAIDRVSWRANLGDAPEMMIERRPLHVRFGALDVALPPLGFLQPTPAGEAALVAAVMEALPAAGRFADLFAGSGTFTGPMLARGAVDVFENVAPTIARARCGQGRSAAQSDPPRSLSRAAEPLPRPSATTPSSSIRRAPAPRRRSEELAATAVPVLVARVLQPRDLRARCAHPGRWRLSARQRPGDRPIHLLASCRAGRGLLETGLCSEWPAKSILTSSARRATASANRNAAASMSIARCRARRCGRYPPRR